MNNAKIVSVKFILYDVFAYKAIFIITKSIDREGYRREAEARELILYQFLIRHENLWWCCVASEIIVAYVLLRKVASKSQISNLLLSAWKFYRIKYVADLRVQR